MAQQKSPGPAGMLSLGKKGNSVKDKLEIIKQVKFLEEKELKRLDKEIQQLKSELSMKEEVFQALDGPKMEIEKQTFAYRGFKFKKNGTAQAGQLMANVAEKCSRKGLHGWIQKSTMSIEGECWGLQDKGKKEEAYKQTRKWFRNQNEYAVHMLAKVVEAEERTGKFAVFE